MQETLANIVYRNDHSVATAALHVEVIGDLVCPFTFLGLKRLDKALDAVRGPVDRGWYPWQLNPELPAEGIEFSDYLSRRFGSPSTVQPVLESLTTEGKGDGIDFRFDRIRRMPNTLNAHQLLYLAEIDGKDSVALAAALQSAFFEEGRDIGDLDVLTQVATAHGIDAASVAAINEDDKARKAVIAREHQVRSSGVSSVPGFLLNRRLLVTGAQDVDTLVNAFDQAMFGEGTDGIESPALN